MVFVLFSVYCTVKFRGAFPPVFSDTCPCFRCRMLQSELRVSVSLCKSDFVDKILSWWSYSEVKYSDADLHQLKIYLSSHATHYYYLSTIHVKSISLPKSPVEFKESLALAFGGKNSAWGRSLVWFFLLFFMFSSRRGCQSCQCLSYGGKAFSKRKLWEDFLKALDLPEHLQKFLP